MASWFGSYGARQNTSDEQSYLMGSGPNDLYSQTGESSASKSTYQDGNSSGSSFTDQPSVSHVGRAQFRRRSKGNPPKQSRQSGFRNSVKVARPPNLNRFLVYDDRSTHFRVLTQLYGSVWPRVLPFCIINVVWTLMIYSLKKAGVIDLTINSIVGHNFMAIMVSFLVVSRAQITYSRFMEARQHLSNAFRSCREIVQFTYVLTIHDREESAKQWRQDVAYRTILMLRLAIAALEYRTSRVHTWDVLPEQQDSLDLICEDGGDCNSELSKENTFRLSRWTHGERSMVDENFRAPLILAYNVRDTVMRQRNGKWLKERMHVNEELRILNFVATFIDAFHGLQKLITTPFPFPLVQMCRTFLFFWIFTLPMVLLGQMQHPVNVCILMFIATYGFLGLEYVSMELDDPFGDDANDFDDLGMAQIVFEDIYINVCKADGVKYAAELRSRTSENFSQGDALENFRRDAQQVSFWYRNSSSVV